MGGKTVDRRITVVTVLFGAVFAALTARLFYLQIIQHAHLTQLAARQHERTIELQPVRGNIYDRHGRLLASNRECQSFYAVPAKVKHPDRTARRLAPVLGVSERVLRRRLTPGKAFVWLKRKVPDDAARRVAAMDLPGIHALTETRRVYPEGRLACHVLGFVGLDNQGLDGVEHRFDRQIQGKPGWLRIARDASGRTVPTTHRVVKEPEAGHDLVLTLDKVVQHVAERELAAAVEAEGARAGSIVVLDPRSGEILALANVPDFDPNHFARFPASARRNRAVRDVFEPGSTFKLVTAAAALQENLFHEEEVIDCGHGSARFQERVVRDHLPHDRLTLREVISLSSNVGAAKIGQRVGARRLFRYARDLGFGRETGVELPGEAQGLLKPVEQWRAGTLASVPFGYEVAVTTLQLAAAYAAAANSGWLCRPTLVRALGPENEFRGHAESRRQVLTVQTAVRLRDILAEAVAAGTGTEARLPHYQVAGKTGTAEKPLADGGGYDPRHHITSFVGFLPAENPQLLVAVVIDDPRRQHWGGLVAGPVFAAVSRQLVAYLGIPPSPAKIFALARDPDGEALPDWGLIAVPALGGWTWDEASRALRQRGLTPMRAGEGTRVATQIPEADTSVAPGSPVTLVLGEGQAVPAAGMRVSVPDVSGRSLRDALRILAAYGFRTRVQGSGMVAQQQPEPSALAAPGAVCRLSCSEPEHRP